MYRLIMELRPCGTDFLNPRLVDNRIVNRIDNRIDNRMDNRIPMQIDRRIEKFIG